MNFSTTNTIISDDQDLLVGQIKRFLELWIGDDEFRSMLHFAPEKVEATYGFPFHPNELRYFWDEEYRSQFGLDRVFVPNDMEVLQKEPELTKIFCQYLRKRAQFRNMMKAENNPEDIRFKSWRDRQIKRIKTMFSAVQEDSTPHIPFAIELSEGCSVGCWFCGVDAPKLQNHFLHTPENQQLFNGVLEALRDLLGKKGGGWGFLYWASDPFDNPDYEQFCLDFKKVFNRIPITTSAQPLKHLAKARRMLELGKEESFPKVRFSMLSKRQLHKLFDEFAPEEFLNVDIVPMNKESLIQKRHTGRARDFLKKRALKRGAEVETLTSQTISCVSGLLINMCDQTIQLTTPCSASDKWRLGYYIYDKFHFEDAADFRTKLEQLVSEHMPLEYPEDRLLRFRDDFKCILQEDGFTVSSEYGDQSYSGNRFYTELAQLIESGKYRVPDIVAYFEEKYGFKPSIPKEWISRLFGDGILDEEPIVTQTEEKQTSPCQS